MKNHIFIFALLSLIFITCYAETCNATHMNFVSKYTLGKQDELNRTFTKIQEKISGVTDVVYKTSGGVEYKISSIKPTFYYRDSKQKATFRGQAVIIIDGGDLEIDLTFYWAKHSSSSIIGNGSAFGLSFELMFGKKLVIDGNSYFFELLDSMPVTMPDDNAFELTRLDPPLPQEDREILLFMLNKMQGQKDAKTQLVTAINSMYNENLNASLHDKHFPIDTKFEYTWRPETVGKKNVTISFQRRPTSVDVESYGIISSFDVQIANDSNWKCGSRKILEMPLDPKLFGGIQEFISFDFYHNVLRWALENSLLDAELKQDSWGYRMFQFYAGDLYEIISGIQNKFYASEVVKGQCKGSASALEVMKNTGSTFNATLKYDCYLQIKNQIVLKFMIDLMVTLAGKPREDYLDFVIVSHSQSVDFRAQGQYTLTNPRLAELMLGDCLNRLYEGKVFGSGWPQSPPRDFPHFRVEQNFTAVLDSSHIDSNLVFQI